MIGALAAVRSEKVSLRYAAKIWNVRRSNLQRRAAALPGIKLKVGHPLPLGDAVESALAAKLLLLADSAFALTVEEVCRLARVVAASLRFDVGNWAGGHKWFRSFMRRHPTLSKRTTTSTVKGRLISFNRQSAAEWFAVAGPILAQYTPRETMNTDNKGWNVEKGGSLVSDAANTLAVCSAHPTMHDSLSHSFPGRRPPRRQERQGGEEVPRQAR
jgi:hypothetical protein